MIYFTPAYLRFSFEICERPAPCLGTKHWQINWLKIFHDARTLSSLKFCDLRSAVLWCFAQFSLTHKVCIFHVFIIIILCWLLGTAYAIVAGRNSIFFPRAPFDSEGQKWVACTLGPLYPMSSTKESFLAVTRAGLVRFPFDRPKPAWTTRRKYARITGVSRCPNIGAETFRWRETA